MADDKKKQGKNKKPSDSLKPTTPDERARALETALAHIEKEYGKGAVMKFGEKINASDYDVVPTGSLSVDLALGIGGVPRGRIIEIYGPESSGKTTVTLHIVAQVQKAGGVAAFIDAEHALDPVYAKKLGVNIDELYISQPDNGEQALEIAEAMVRSCAIDIIIVDSVAALVPRAEIEGEMGDSHVGLHARLMSQALRKLAGIVYRNNCIVMFTNQLRDKIGVSYGSPETTTGGRALKFYASIRLDIRKAESIKVGEEIVGSRTKLKVAKNKLAPPFKSCEFDIIFGEGISRTGDVLDLAIEKGIANKSGAWFSYGEIRLGQGRENAKNYLKENPEILEELENKVRAEFGLPPVNEAAEAAKDAIVAPKQEPKAKNTKAGVRSGARDADDMPLNIELVEQDDDDLPEEFLAEFPDEDLNISLGDE